MTMKISSSITPSVMYSCALSTVFLLLLLFSCDTKHTTADADNSLFTVKVENESADRGEFGKLFRLARYVVLETTQQSLINRMDKVQFDGGRIYILSTLQNSVFIFDDSGKFIKTFNRYGRAPGEYLSISDFEVVDGRMHIFDDNRGLLLHYDDNGKYLTEEKIERGESFKLLPDNLRVVNVNNSGAYIDYYKSLGENYAVVRDQKLRYTDIPYPPSVFAMRRRSEDGGRPAFFAHRDSLFALFTMNDMVYSVDKTTGLLKGYIHYVFPKPKPPYNAPEEEYMDHFQSQGEEGYYSDLRCFMKFREYDFVSYTESNVAKYVISRGNELLFNGEFLDVNNGLPVSELSYLDNAPDTEKQFVSKIHPYVLTQILNHSSEKHYTNKELIGEILSYTSEDGNPVLLFYDWIYD